MMGSNSARDGKERGVNTGQMGRCSPLLRRSFPELMIIVKGLAFAARSVCVFSLLWFIITYAFAIILRQLTEASGVTLHMIWNI